MSPFLPAEQAPGTAFAVNANGGRAQAHFACAIVLLEVAKGGKAPGQHDVHARVGAGVGPRDCASWGARGRARGRGVGGWRTLLCEHGRTSPTSGSCIGWG